MGVNGVAHDSPFCPKRYSVPESDRPVGDEQALFLAGKQRDETKVPPGLSVVVFLQIEKAVVHRFCVGGVVAVVNIWKNDDTLSSAQRCDTEV